MSIHGQVLRYRTTFVKVVTEMMVMVDRQEGSRITFGLATYT